jgi:glycosyltransferase involved in cell wall biosynthesis
MKKILVLTDYYLPGFKCGGMRTIANMVDRLGGRYDFSVVTRNHDGRYDTTPYTSVRTGEWNRVGQANVYYLAPGEMKISRIEALVKEAAPDAIYLNSVFATPANYLLFLRWRGRVKCPVILAPCGELDERAVEFKSTKKKVHFFASNLAGLHKGLIWKASTELEKRDIERVFGQNTDVFVAADLPLKTIFPGYEQSLKPHKTEGELKLVFLARFVRTKNFGFLLDVLDNARDELTGNIAIDVIGDLEDKAYWDECVEKMGRLPDTIRVNYAGAIDNRLIPKKLAEYHFLISPTLNENFGHVFIEALASGCPLIISDRSPWRDLADKGIGWDIALENRAAWGEILEKALRMGNEEYSVVSVASRRYAEDWLADESLERDTVAVLEASVNI